MRVPGLPAPPWVVAHRGDSLRWPENSLAAIRSAVEVGAHAVEIDLQLSRDGSLVVFHDWDTKRLTGEAGLVEGLTRRDLEALRIGGTEARVPSLERVLTEVPRHLPLNLELKRRTAKPELMAQTLLETISHRAATWVSSFDWDLLRRIRDRAPALPLAPLADRSVAGLFETAEVLHAVSVHVHRRLVGRALVSRCREAGRALLVYTVNDPSEASRLVRLGVSGFFTDDPGGVLAALGTAAEGGGPS